MRFNQTNVIPADVTRNAEGEIAYRITPELEFFSLLATTLVEKNDFYRSRDQRLARIAQMIRTKEITPRFAAQCASFVRNVYNNRTAPLYVIIQLAINRTLTAKGVQKTIARADEMAELYAAYAHLAPMPDGSQRGKRTKTGQVKYLSHVSAALHRGIAKRFWDFDEYQLAKNDHAGREVSLKDVVFQSHPLAALKHRTPAQIDLVRRIIAGELNVPDTWEVALSAVGKDPEAKKREWIRLITEKNAKGFFKLGYMALLRNLRNIIQAGVDPAIVSEFVAARLADPAQVKYSKQFPFRFFSAYRELKPVLAQNPKYRFLAPAINEAATASIFNIPGFEHINNGLIAADVSGSMQTALSANSSIQNWDLGLILGFLLQAATQSDIGIFGSSFKMLSPSHEMVMDNILEGKRISNSVGLSTNGHLVLDHALRNRGRKLYDHVFMFTDCQMWDSTGHGGYQNAKGQPESPMQALWREYRRANPKAKLYLFDLSGYGNTPVRISTNGASMISGWSDHIFQVLADMENGQDFLSKIHAIDV